MKSFLKFILFFLLIAFLAIGFYAGNFTYNTLLDSPWDEILGVENDRHETAGIHTAEAEYGWRPIDVYSKDGTRLHGTFIDSGKNGSPTVILLHGLYQNRSRCMSYISIYRPLGYNILLVDLRGHGESGGDHTDWGLHDTDDMNAWIEWLHKINPSMKIGMHGISLGAAMALIYAGSNEGHQLSFVVEDSSYGNLRELARGKLIRYTGDNRLVWGLEALNPFFQAVMFIHTGKILHDIDPIHAVSQMTCPVLFLHGTMDTLIPFGTARELYNTCSSRDKKLILFEGAAHADEITSNQEEYVRNVRNFVRSAVR